VQVEDPCLFDLIVQLKEQRDRNDQDTVTVMNAAVNFGTADLENALAFTYP
jgi:hypothetical protein